ncbi:MAG: MFS transporter [Proteobacteria bacterium]|nr:MFS transporter [Pseudomonadota bacterium]
MNKKHIVQIIVLYIGTVFIISNIHVAQPILPMLTKDFNVSDQTASLAVSISILFLSLTLLIYGPFSDFFGRKHIMVSTGFLLAIPTFLIVFSENFDFFLLMRALQGCFVSGMSAIAMAYISEEFPWQLLGRVMGIYILGMITAGLTGRVLGGVISGYFGWKAMFVFFSLLNMIGSFLMLIYLPSSKNFVKNLSIKESFKGMFSHLKNRILLGAFIIAFSLFFTFTCAFTYVSFYLSKPPFNLSTVKLSMIYFVYIAGLISPFAGSYSNKVGRKPVILLGLVTAIIGISITLIKSTILVVIGLLFLCLGLFITQPSASSMVGENAKSAKGSATSLYLFSYYFGGSIGAYLPGYLWNLYGWHGIFLISLIMILVAITSLLTLCK